MMRWPIIRVPNAVQYLDRAFPKSKIESLTKDNVPTFLDLLKTFSWRTEPVTIDDDLRSVYGGYT